MKMKQSSMFPKICLPKMMAQPKIGEPTRGSVPPLLIRSLDASSAACTPRHILCILLHLFLRLGLVKDVDATSGTARLIRVMESTSHAGRYRYCNLTRQARTGNKNITVERGLGHLPLLSYLFYR